MLRLGVIKVRMLICKEIDDRFDSTKNKVIRSEAQTVINLELVTSIVAFQDYYIITTTDGTKRRVISKYLDDIFEHKDEIIK